jgi:hypothetical protein
VPSEVVAEAKEKADVLKKRPSVHEIRKITTRYRLRSNVNLLLRRGVRVHVECRKAEFKYPRVQRFRGSHLWPKTCQEASNADCYFITQGTNSHRFTARSKRRRNGATKHYGTNSQQAVPARLRRCSAPKGFSLLVYSETFVNISIGNFRAFGFLLVLPLAFDF